MAPPWGDLRKGPHRRPSCKPLADHLLAWGHEPICGLQTQEKLPPGSQEFWSGVQSRGGGPPSRAPQHHGAPRWPDCRKPRWGSGDPAGPRDRGRTRWGLSSGPGAPPSSPRFQSPCWNWQAVTLGGDPSRFSGLKVLRRAVQARAGLRDRTHEVSGQKFAGLRTAVGLVPLAALRGSRDSPARTSRLARGALCWRVSLSAAPG